MSTCATKGSGWSRNGSKENDNMIVPTLTLALLQKSNAVCEKPKNQSLPSLRNRDKRSVCAFSLLLLI